MKKTRVTASRDGDVVFDESVVFVGAVEGIRQVGGIRQAQGIRQDVELKSGTTREDFMIAPRD